MSLIGSTVHVGNLDVPLNAAVEYMRGIPEEKWEAAFVHAVQVGMAEIVARRRRFDTAAHRTPEIVTTRPAPIATAPRAEEHVEEAPVQPRVTLPPEPRVETVEAIAPERCPDVVTPSPEPEGWLRRLDDELESFDAVQPLDASRTGR